MLKLIAALIPFVKELFFDKKEEMDFKSPYFNAKKWFQYILFLLLFVVILFVGGRLFTISVRYIELEKELNELKLQHEIKIQNLESCVNNNQVLSNENNTLRTICFEKEQNKNKSKK